MARTGGPEGPVGRQLLDGQLDAARALVEDPRILVSDIERELDTRYTADTLAALIKRHPAVDFVWVMGADNLIEISHWHDWLAIFETIPVAVFARPAYSSKALISEAAGRFSRCRLNENRADQLVERKPPAWMFLHIPLSTASATRIRGETPGGTRGGPKSRR